MIYVCIGYGLRAKEPVAEGDIVVEYLGEVYISYYYNHTYIRVYAPPYVMYTRVCVVRVQVISEAEVQRRFLDQRLNTPSDRDYYVMALG